MGISKRRALFSTVSPLTWEGGGGRGLLGAQDLERLGLLWDQPPVLDLTPIWVVSFKQPAPVWGQDADFSCGCEGLSRRLGSFILISSLSWTQAPFFQTAVLILLQVLFLGSLLLETLDEPFKVPETQHAHLCNGGKGFTSFTHWDVHACWSLKPLLHGTLGRSNLPYGARVRSNYPYITALPSPWWYKDNMYSFSGEKKMEIWMFCMPEEAAATSF